MPEEQFYTVEDVAKRLKVHPNQVRRWINSGELLAFDLGKGYRISEEDLQKFLATRRTAKDDKD